MTAPKRNAARTSRAPTRSARSWRPPGSPSRTSPAARRSGAAASDGARRRHPGEGRDPASPYKLLVLRDDRQVDVARPAVILRRIADLEAADVVVVHRLQRADEALARRVLARAAQAFDHDLRGDESLEAREIRLLAFRGDELAVFLDDRDAVVPGERHHLRDLHAAAFGAELLGERLAADEGDVPEARLQVRL